MTRDDLRKRLEELTDAELLARCVCDIAEQRRWRGHKGLRELRELCWAECLRRNREDIFTLALGKVKELEDERRRINSV